MGADGHITILDWSLIKAKFPERSEEWLRECFGRSVYVYSNPFDRKRVVLVFYWDTEGHTANVRVCLQPSYVKDSAGEWRCIGFSVEYPTTQEEYEAELRKIQGLSFDVKGRWEVFEWAMKNALIAVWEVWT